MTGDDPELGPVRWCKGCREWWPDDPEFWNYYVVPAGTPVQKGYVRRTPNLTARCRGCYADRARQRRSRLVVGRVVETPDGTFLEPVG